MALPNLQKFEKLVDIGSGLAIYKIHIDAFREQESNARIMSKDTFDRLKANIAKDSRLESLPFVTIKNNQAGNDEFLIISGHHRIRAARMAELEYIHALVNETELTDDQIKSKVLSHNSLNGFDDPQILKKIYDEINDIEMKLASGLLSSDILDKSMSVKVDDISIPFEYELVSILFLKQHAEHFDKIMDKIAISKIHLADKADFDRFADTITNVSEKYEVRNLASIFVTIMDIVEKALAEEEKEV